MQRALVRQSLTFIAISFGIALSFNLSGCGDASDAQEFVPALDGAVTPESDGAVIAPNDAQVLPSDASVPLSDGATPPPPACGAAGQGCCVDQLCNAGLVCKAGACSSAVAASSCPAGSPAWGFVSELAPPATMAPYDRVTTFATFRNCSGATAPANGNLRLGFNVPRDLAPFGLSRILFAVDVPNASEITIPIVVRAPPLTGGYFYGWGLLNEGVAWLDAVTPPHVMDVQAAAKSATICAGVTGDIGGATAATAALQTCINNTPSGGTLEIPGGIYRIDGELSIPNPITIRTAGSVAGSPNCWDHESTTCAVLRASENINVPRGFFYVRSGSEVHLDRIVLDGNRGNRLQSTAAATCAGGTNGAGFNAHSDNCANCSFKRGMSARALCGTGWEWTGDGATIENNVFYGNGDHNTKMMWSDGLTLLASNNSAVRGNQFVDNSDIDFISGGAQNATFENNSVQHVLQASFGGLMLDNFNGGTTGNFVGTMVKNNSINCGALLCDFGIELGPHAWYLSNNIIGGTVTGNGVVGARIQINAEGAGTAANPMVVSGNILGPTSATAKYGCGQTRTATAFNVSPDSFVTTANGTAKFTYHVCP